MFKKLFDLYGEQRHLLYKATLLRILELAFFGSGLAFIYLTIRNLLAGTLSQQLALFYVAGFLLCLTTAYILNNICKSRYHAKTSFIMAKERIKLADHIKTLPMGFFNKESAGDLNNTLTESVRSLEGLPYLFDKIMALLALGIFLPLFALLDWRMTIAMLLGLPLAFYVLLRGGDTAEGELLKRQNIQGRVSEAAVEFIGGIKEVKAFGKSATSLKKYQQAIADFKAQNLKLEKTFIPKLLTYQLAVNMGLILVVILGAYLLINGGLSLALYVLFLIVTLKLCVSLQELGGSMLAIKMANAGLTKVNNIYKNKPQPETVEERKIERYDIEFKNVSFAYEDELVLKNISFYVPENTTIALIGPSGSGKTTITNLIARFWDIGQGEIKIGGINIKDVKVEELLSHISMVFQDVYLFGDTILNNIKMAKQEATQEEVIAAAKKANCHEFIMQLPDKYETVVGEGGGKLSAGEKQRISLARAFLKDAPIILLDEATANVDPENELIIQSSINELVKNKTAIIIAHKLSTIKAAHQILVLEQGQIVQRGTHAELGKTAGGIYNDYMIGRQKASGWMITN